MQTFMASEESILSTFIHLQNEGTGQDINHTIKIYNYFFYTTDVIIVWTRLILTQILRSVWAPMLEGVEGIKLNED